MSIVDEPRTLQVALRHPNGHVRLKVPADVPLGELIPDFLDIAELPDDTGWAVSRSGNGEEPYPEDRTLAQLGATAGGSLDGAVLELHPQPASPPATAENEPEHTAPPSEPWTTLEEQPEEDLEQDRERSLRERSASRLPARLSRPARAHLTVRALASDPAAIERSRTGGSPTALDPATFTRPARVSPAARMRATWRSSEYQHRLDQEVLAVLLRRCVKIAVISPKGGVGKTTVAALLGSLLAFLRRDRTIAVETNPDWGSLGRRLVPDHKIFIDDLLGPLQNAELSPTQLDAQLGRGPDGLMVAPAPTDPDRATKLDEAAYRTLFERLAQLAGTLVLDCGTGLDDPPARAALACADQLVLVCDDEPDTASIVAEAAGSLAQAQSLILVVNNIRRSSRIDIPALEREIKFANGLAIIPRDEHAAGQLHGSRFTWNHAPAHCQTPVRELAALLTADWSRLQIAQRC